MTKKISVALVGAGAMGGALLNGWLAKGVIDCARSAVFDPAAARLDDAARRSVAVNPAIGAQKFDALVLAVKPQIAAEALPPFATIAKEALVLSVMAGKSVAAISAALGGARRIVRAMPNLPAAVGAGGSALYAGDGVGEPGRAIAQSLMGAVGATVWLGDEKSIDAATAVSGSGPAYFFLMGEALADAGRALGLSEEAATTLARATLVGAGAYAADDARTLAELRRAVTSPGGTTEAALKVLDGDDRALRRLMKAAAEAAARRAGELTR